MSGNYNFCRTRTNDCSTRGDDSRSSAKSISKLQTSDALKVVDTATQIEGETRKVGSGGNWIKGS